MSNKFCLLSVFGEVLFRLLFLLIATSLLSENGIAAVKYKPPKATVLPLYPKGLRISIPDESGISLVAFHVKINENFQGLESGSIARDVTSPRDGFWTYQDHTTELTLDNDIIYYWIHVIYKGLGYNLVDQEHAVNEYFNTDGTSATTQSQEKKENSGSNRHCDSSETCVYDKKGEKLAETCAGELIFHDDFPGHHLNSSQWRVIEQFSDAPDYEFVVYRNSPENIKIERGKLFLIPSLAENVSDLSTLQERLLDGCTGKAGTKECQRTSRGSDILPPINSARIDTNNLFSFTYGRIEVRAKLPLGDWIYPLLTLEPIPRLDKYERNLEESVNTGSVQLFIAFAAGNRVLRSSNGHDFSNHVIWAGPVKRSDSDSDEDDCILNEKRISRHSSDLWSDEFHVFELEWKPHKIVFSVDNVQYGEQNVDIPQDQKYILHIGVGVGGHKKFPDMITSDGYHKPWRNVGARALFDFSNASNLWKKSWKQESTTLQVDYVKVYAL